MNLQPYTSDYSFDPHATWGRLLEQKTLIGYDPALGLWLIGGHEPVRKVLADPRFANAATLSPIIDLVDGAQHVLSHLDAPAVAVTADGPQHRRLRPLLQSLFPHTVDHVEQQWGRLIRDRAEQLADELGNTDSPTDLMQYAVRFPLHIVLDIAGVPAGDSDSIRRWTDSFALLVWGQPDPLEQLSAAHDALGLWRYCQHAVDQRLHGDEPGPGLLGDLLRHRADDDTRLTAAEIAALIMNVIGAGWETTAGALGSALYHGLTNRRRWQRLAHDAHLRSTHVEETLRHSPAIDAWLRITTTPVTLDQITIPEHSRCLVLIGTANHDPAVFDNPDAFDPGRPHLSRHLAFGAGPHHCIGAALARVELTTALRTLAERLPDLHLTPGLRPRHHPSAALRRYTSLPAATHATASETARCPIRDQPASIDPAGTEAGRR
jgi:cytochrome P450